MELHKLGVKVFAGNGEDVGLLEFIPVFHRWIQGQVLDDLLIDVADYSHMHAGPGIVLVAHEGNYGFDETGERRGLVYYSKHEIPGHLHDRLVVVLKKALGACRRLEQEAEFTGRLRFRGDELQVFANDRLAAPNTDETFAAFEPVLRALLDKLYPETVYDLVREPDPKDRFAVTVRAARPLEPATLLNRLP